MTVGKHTLTVVKDGYVTSEQTITVVEDRAKQITISLFPASPPLMDILRAGGPAPATLIGGCILILLVIRVFVERIVKSAKLLTITRLQREVTGIYRNRMVFYIDELATGKRRPPCMRIRLRS